MTKKDFKEAVLRGHGRCIQAVQEKPEKYRDIVLWACQRNISYDAQCEGTRSWYVYTMASVYPDKEIFINAAADAQTVNRYAMAYREQLQPELRAQALDAFSCCPYPDDPQPIMEDTRSFCEALRNGAWRALENMRHPAVREFALKNAAKGDRNWENFGLLVTNFTPEDEVLLEKLLREMIEAKAWDDLHAAGLDIYRAFYKDSGIPHPKHLLPLLYEYNPCSLCRESALVYMSRHRMLTEEILAECLYDSNDDIRRMAQRRMSKR